MKRRLIALAALLVGGGVSATLLVLASPSRHSTEVYVAARDIPAGAQLGSDAIALARTTLVESRGLLFTLGDESKLANVRTTHYLVAGQLIQRSDVASADASADRRLVFMPIKDAPPVASGARIDLLAITGPPDRPVVQPFAVGVEVRASVTGGMVLVVASRQAAAFVYGANAMHLVAVIAEPGAAAGSEEPVATSQQAMDMAAQP
jgi:hypothetical protein